MALARPKEEGKRASKAKEGKEDVESPHSAHVQAPRLDRHPDGRSDDRGKQIQRERGAGSRREELGDRAGRLRPEENVARSKRLMEHRNAREEKAQDGKQKIDYFEAGAAWIAHGISR